MMQDIYAWLTDFLGARKRLSAPMVIGDFLPPVFECYFFIEWCYGIIDDFPFDEYPDDTEEIDNLNKRHEIERRFGLFMKTDTERLFRPVSVQELAWRFGVPYSIHTTDEIRQTPGVQILPYRTESVFRSLITTLEQDQSLYLYVEDAGRLRVYGEAFEERTDGITADGYLHFQDRTRYDTYSYLFPEDHRWCLVTLEDLPYFMFACDGLTASQLSTIEGLEYFAAPPDGIVDLGW